MLARITLLALFCVAVPLHAVPPSDVDYSKASIDKLIDDLTLIDSSAPGVNSAGIYGGFIAENAPGEFQVGVLGVPPPKVPPQMSELVRRGLIALPALIAHLNDARPTKLAVGNEELPPGSTQPRIVGVNTFMFEYLSNEYDPRIRPSHRVSAENYLMKDFSGRYTVKVGDVCYALIGQIVNRSLLPVRYQPSAGLVVNSPVEVPALIAQVKDDWGDADAETLKASLLSDIRSGTLLYQYGSAFARLLFYFPETYNQLKGEDLAKRTDFEANEPGKKPSN
ncbi:MAG: hypothetical protein ABSG84_15670 [Acidobacteriaceae bacterium]|jgi:hypothetical protein